MAYDNLHTRRERLRQLDRLEPSLLAKKTDLADMVRQSDFREMRIQMETMFLRMLGEISELRKQVERIDGNSARLLSSEQFFELLGGSLSMRTIRKMCADGRLPAHKQGRKWFISAHKIEEWMEENGMEDSCR